MSMKDHHTYLGRYERELRHFLRTAKKDGFKVAAVRDGEGELWRNVGEKQVIAESMSCEEGIVYFTHPDYPKFHISAWVLAGNGPGELISDWGWKENTPQEMLDRFDKVHSISSDYCERIIE